MADVFISYARAERDVAERIAQRLKAHGLSVFLDIDGLDGGDVFSEKLDREVKTSGAVLGLWSPLALTRPWVQIECDIGKRRGVLVPAAIKPFEEMQVPAQFWNIQHVDLTDLSDSPEDPNWLKLMKSLSRTLNRSDLGPLRAAMDADAEASRQQRRIVSPRPDALPRVDAAVLYILAWRAMARDTITLDRLASEANRVLKGKAKLKPAALGASLNRISYFLLKVSQERKEPIPLLASLAVEPGTHLPPRLIDAAARAFWDESYPAAEAKLRKAELESERERAMARLQTAVFAYADWTSLLPYAGLSPANPEAYLAGEVGGSFIGDRRGIRTPHLIGAALLALLVGGGAIWLADPFGWKTPSAPPGTIEPGFPPDVSQIDPTQTPAIVDPGQFPMLPPSPEKGAPPATVPSIFERLFVADIGRGEQLAQRCMPCHSFKRDGANLVGPPLQNVVGRDIAAVAGYRYSSALAAVPGVWDEAMLDRWLANSRGFAPGTSESFAGLSDPQSRADIIAWLKVIAVTRQ